MNSSIQLMSPLKNGELSSIHLTTIHGSILKVEYFMNFFETWIIVGINLKNSDLDKKEIYYKV